MDSTTPPDTTVHLTTEFNLAVERAMDITPLNTLSNAVGTVIRMDHDLEMGSNHTQGNPLDDISHNNNMTSLSQPEATRPLLSHKIFPASFAQQSNTPLMPLHRSTIPLPRLTALQTMNYSNQACCPLDICVQLMTYNQVTMPGTYAPAPERSGTEF